MSRVDSGSFRGYIGGMKYFKQTPEEWRAVDGFDGVYEVSSLGRIRSLNREVSSANRHGPFVARLKGRKLKLEMLANGYYFVRLGLGERGRAWLVPVHQLVLTAFHGPRPNGNVARHLNDEKTDNRAENLAWGTRSENALDAQKNGRMPKKERT